MMNKIDLVDLRRFDLNLLLPLVALVEEASVSKAAARLGLGQPAMSNALARLRILLDDEVLVRTGQRMQPTGFALDLAQRVAGHLEHLKDDLDNGSGFDPGSAERVFRLGLADKYESSHGVRLADALARAAPSVALRIEAVPRQAVGTALDDGKVDVFLGALPALQSWHRAEVLYAEDFVVLVPPGRRGKLDLEAYCGARHVICSVSDQMDSRVDLALAKTGRARRVAVSTPHALAAPAYVRQGLLFTTVESFARTAARQFDLRVKPLPLALDGVEIVMAWHGKSDGDAGLTWFRRQLAGAVGKGRSGRRRT